MSKSPVVLSELLTSSTRLEIELGKLIAGLDDDLGQLLRAAGHHVEDGRGLLREAVGDAIKPDRHHVLQIGGDFRELVADVIGLEVEGCGQTVAGAADRLAGRGGGDFQAFQHIAAALAELLDHRVASVAERARDVLAFLGERHGDATGSVVHLFGDELADLRDVRTEVEMDAVDGVANLLGLADQRVALAAKILQQTANAHLVVVISMFQRGDFVGNQRFEFGGARERAFHAVAHSRNLATDRLSDGDDGLACNGLGFCHPHGDFGHRLGDEPQFLRAPRHMGEHVEKDDRREVDQAHHCEYGRCQAARTERRPQRGNVKPAQRKAGQHPDAGKDTGENVGRARGAALAAPAKYRRSNSRSSLAGRRDVGVSSRGRSWSKRLVVSAGSERRPGQGASAAGSSGTVRRFRRRGRGFRRLVVIPHLKGVLDGRKRRFRRILHFLRGVGHDRRRLIVPLCSVAVGTVFGPRQECVILEIPLGSPLCSHPKSRHQDIPLPSRHPIG